MAISLTLGVACGGRTGLGVLELEDDSGALVDSGRDTGAVPMPFYGASPFDASIRRDAAVLDASQDAGPDSSGTPIYGAPPLPDE